MSQAANFSVPLIGPVTPTMMATRIDDSFEAMRSSHSGAARPPYAVKGTLWLSDAMPGLDRYFFFDGVNDHLAVTIDTTTGGITYGARTMSDDLDMGGHAIQDAAMVGQRGFLYGLTLSNNAADAANDFDIAPGAAASDDAVPGIISLSAVMTKRMDAAWAPGSGNGGWLDGAAMPASATGHCFLIGKSSDPTAADVIFTASLTPALPNGWDRKRRIMSVLRTDTGVNRIIKQIGNRVLLGGPVSNRAGTGVVTNALVGVTVPVGLQLRPILMNNMSMNPSSSCSIFMSDGDATTAPNAAVQNVNSSGSDCAIIEHLYTNTAGQIRYTVGLGAGTILGNNLNTLGWWDDRGING